MNSILLDTREPAYRQAADMIRIMIATEKMSVGQELPTYRKLSEMLRVSYVTIKKAMDLLVEEGLVERCQGRGCQVAKIVPLGDKIVDNEAETPLKVIVPRSLVRNLTGKTTEGSRPDQAPVRVFGFTGLTNLMKDPMGEALMNGLEHGCAQNYQPLLFHCLQMNKVLHRLPDSLLQQEVLGNVCFRPFDNAYLMDLRQRCPQLISVDRDATSFDVSSVVTATLEGSLLATSQLLQAGHKKIAYVGNSLNKETTGGVDPAVRERFKGFQLAHQAFGVQLDNALCLSVPQFSKKHIDKVVTELIASGREFSAIVTYDDNVGQHVLDILTKSGRRVPADCSLVCAGGVSPSGDIAGAYFKFDTLAEEVLKLCESSASHSDVQLLEIPAEFKDGKTF